MKKLIILLAASTLLISCATRREQAIMDSWLDRSKAELISEWGPPTSTASYGHGVEVLSYNQYRTYSIPVFYVGSNNTIYYVHLGSQ